MIPSNSDGNFFGLTDVTELFEKKKRIRVYYFIVATLEAPLGV